MGAEAIILDLLTQHQPWSQTTLIERMNERRSLRDGRRAAGDTWANTLLGRI